MNDDPSWPDGLVEAKDSVAVKAHYTNPGSFRVIAPVANRAYANFLQIHGIAQKLPQSSSSASASATASATAALGYPAAGATPPSNGQSMAAQPPYGAPATNPQLGPGQPATIGGSQTMDQQTGPGGLPQTQQQYPQNPQAPANGQNGLPATQQYGSTEANMQQTSGYSSGGQTTNPQASTPNSGMGPVNQPSSQGYGAAGPPYGTQAQVQHQMNPVANPSQQQTYGTNTQQTYGGVARRGEWDNLKSDVGLGGSKSTSAGAGPEATSPPSSSSGSQGQQGSQGPNGTSGDNPVIAQQPWLLPAPPGMPVMPNPCVPSGMIFPTANAMECFEFKPLLLKSINPNMTVTITDIIWRNIPASQLELAVQGEEIPLDTNAPPQALVNAGNINCHRPGAPGMGAMPPAGGMGGMPPAGGTGGMPPVSGMGGASPPLRRLKRRFMDDVDLAYGEKG